jgi:FkbH-like protein
MIRKDNRAAGTLGIVRERDMFHSGAKLPDKSIVIAATFTAEPIRDSLSFFMKELGQATRIEFGPYNQVFQQLLDPSSLLRTNQSGVNVLLLRLEDWANAEASQNGACVFAENAAENIRRNAIDFVQAMRSATLLSGVPYLVVLCPASASAKSVPGICNQLDSVEEMIRAELEPLGVHSVTSQVLADLYPVSEYDDPRANRLAHMPYTPLSFAAVGTMIARRVYGLQVAPHKVIVLDCDQTLWKGVCGEDGALGIEVDPPRRALQEFMIQQHGSGKLLCLCSRNNEEDVFEVFERRQEMPVRREHIISWRINWGLKSENLHSLADELNLGLESFIFVDDDPAVCLEVRENCPEVLTLQLPGEPSEIPRFLNHIWAFDCVASTREDMQRTQLYEQNIQRERLRGETAGLGDFLTSLCLKIEISELAAENVARVSQLTQRTNQFNFTTIRRSEPEIQQLYQTGRVQCLTASVIDRFGDYGLVGVIMFAEGKAALEIDTFLLSCRALGRGVEHKMLAQVGAMALERGLGYVDLRYSETPKNRPALEFAQQLKVEETKDSRQDRVFRIPASLAASLTFDVSDQSANPLGPVKEDLTKPGRMSHAIHQPGHTFLHQIATELFDAQQILAAVSAEKERLRPVTAPAPVAAHDQVESKLKTIWESILRVRPIGVDDDYFELGGDSFLAVSLFLEIESEFNKALPLATLLNAPTIRQLGELLRENTKDHTWNSLVPLQPEGQRPPLYCMHAAGGNVLFYRDLAIHLGRNQPLYGLQSRGMDRSQTNHDRVEDMAAYYLMEIRAFQPKGPYYLAGSSFGGLVAFEMARQLESMGQSVGLLALFDTYGPGYPQRLPGSSPLQTMTAEWRHRALFVRDSLKLLGPREKIQYVVKKAEKVRKILRRRLAWKKNEIAIAFNSATGRPLPKDMQRNHKAIEQALGHYKPQLYGGRITLFRAETQPTGILPDPTLGWNGLAGGGLEIYEVPGFHGAVTVDPHAKFLAEKLEPCLLAAQSGQERYGSSRLWNTSHRGEKPRVVSTVSVG